MLTCVITGHALNHETQLPVLAESIGSTSGIWAPALRFHNGTFYLLTTMVHDKRADNDSSRWDNVCVQLYILARVTIDAPRSSFRLPICEMRANGLMPCISTLKDTISARTGMMRATHMSSAVMPGRWREYLMVRLCLGDTDPHSDTAFISIG
jgi:hypothetical protein